VNDRLPKPSAEAKFFQPSALGKLAVTKK